MFSKDGYNKLCEKISRNLSIRKMKNENEILKTVCVLIREDNEDMKKEMKRMQKHIAYLERKLARANREKSLLAYNLDVERNKVYLLNNGVYVEGVDEYIYNPQVGPYFDDDGYFP